MQPQRAFGCFPSKAQKWQKHKPRSPPAALSGPCVLWLECKLGERHRQEGYEGRQGEEGSEREKKCHQHFGCRRRQKREREGEKVPRRVERWQSTTKSLAVLTDQTVLCIRAAWHFFFFLFKKNVNIDLGCCSRRCFHSRRDWSHSNSSSSCSNGSKSSALQFRAHTRAALNMNERRAAVRLRHPKEERERPREGEGGRESVTGVRHLAAQMRYSGCPGALLHGVCRWQHWTLVFLISFCTGWTAVIKGYTF